MWEKEEDLENTKGLVDKFEGRLGVDRRGQKKDEK